MVQLVQCSCITLDGKRCRIKSPNKMCHIHSRVPCRKSIFKHSPKSTHTVVDSPLTEFFKSHGVQHTCEIHVKGNLDLSKKNLRQLPDDFGSLRVDGHLNLSNNKLSSLPESFARINVRGDLNLSNNEIKEIPSNWKELNVRGNIFGFDANQINKWFKTHSLTTRCGNDMDPTTHNDLYNTEDNAPLTSTDIVQLSFSDQNETNNVCFLTDSLQRIMERFSEQYEDYISIKSFGSGLSEVGVTSTVFNDLSTLLLDHKKEGVNKPLSIRLEKSTEHDSHPLTIYSAYTAKRLPSFIRFVQFSSQYASTASVTLNGHTSNVESVCVLPDGNLASGSQDKSIKIWDIRSSGECIRTLNDHSGVWSVCALPDGNLASCSLDESIKIWDIRSWGESIQTLNGHTSYVRSVCVLPDGNLASGSLDGSIKIWDISSGECIRTLKGHIYWVTSVCALPDGNLASSSQDKSIKIWDIRSSGECIRTLNDHSSVCSVCVLPDGNLASCSLDESIKIWDISSGECIRTLNGHTSFVVSLCVLPDGNLASCSADKSIKIWHNIHPQI